MKNFIWKLLFCFHMMRIAKTEFGFSWECAESWLEMFGIFECSPFEAVEEEISNWS